MENKKHLTILFFYFVNAFYFEMLKLNLLNQSLKSFIRLLKSIK